MPKKTFPIEEVKKYLEEGETIEQLAQRFNTSRPTMRKWLKENNLKTAKIARTEEIKKIDASLICEDYTNKLTIQQIMEKYSISDSVVKRILKENNIHIYKQRVSHTKYPCDISYFDNINTANKAYLLGFICTDGFVTKTNEIGIGLQKKDLAMIEFFKNELKSSKPIIEKDNCYELRLQNKILAEKLISYSIIPNKSLVLNIDEVIKKANIPENLIHYFLLGYFDGDGGIYKSEGNYYGIMYSCSVTGTLETCQYFKEYFDNIGFFTKRDKESNTNNYTYQIGGRNMVKKGLSKLYNNLSELTFFYQRKYKIFCEL